MACQTCKNQQGKVLATASGLPYRMKSSVGLVTGVNGRRYPIATCLIPNNRQPRDGWAVEFYIKGQRHEIDGHPRSIYLEAKRLFDLNAVPYNNTELWLNLNLQWTSRAIERYQKVRFEHLLAIATPNEKYDEQIQE